MTDLELVRTSDPKYDQDLTNKKYVDQTIESALSDIPTDVLTKATASDINTGTDDTKYATSKALKDSDVAFLSDIPASLTKASYTEINTGTDDSKYVTSKGIKDSDIAFTSDLPTRATLNLDTDDTVTFANLSGNNTGDETTNTIKTKLGAATASTDGYATSTQITKLDGIAAGAEVNVQSDWNQATNTADDYIKNKPTIPTKTSDLSNDSNFVADASYVHTDNNFTDALETKLTGIAAGAEVNVNADWNAVSGDAQILNKPTLATQYTDEMAQDAVGGMVNTTLTYTDGTPELKVTNPVTPAAVGFTISAGTTPKTLTVADTASVTGTNTGDQSSSDFDIKDLTDSTNLRTEWSGKQDALGFTPENVANKKTSLTDNSDTYYPTQKAVKTVTDAKQATLVSGTNIKSINGTSLLGSGDLTTQTLTKAIGTDINTGTDDAKYVTSKAIQDSDIAFVRDLDTTYVESGTSIVMTDASDVSVVEVTLSGNTIQQEADTAPEVTMTSSPTTINLCPDYNNYCAWESGNYSSSTGAKEAYPQRIRLINLLPVLPNTVYYFHTNNTTYQFSARAYGTNGAFVSSIGGITNTGTITTAANVYFLGIIIYNATSETGITIGTYYNLFLANTLRPFICLNSEADKTFVAYGENKYILGGATTQTGIPTPDNPIALVNTYPAGTYKTNISGTYYYFTLDDDIRSLPNGVNDRLLIDAVNKTSIVKRKIGNVLYSNVASIAFWAGTGNYYSAPTFLIGALPSGTLPDIYSNKASRAVPINYLDGTCYFTGSTFVLFGNNVNNVATYNSRYAGAIFYYQLLTATTTTLTMHEFNVPAPNNQIEMVSVTGDITLTMTNGVDTNTSLVALSTKKLCSLPNGTKDTILVKDGTSTMTQLLDEILLDGTTETWTGTNPFVCDIGAKNNNVGTAIPLNSDYFRPVSTDDFATSPDSIEIDADGKVQVNITASLIAEQTAEAFATWLTTHNTTVLYEIEEVELDLGTSDILETYRTSSTLTNDKDAPMSIEYVRYNDITDYLKRYYTRQEETALLEIRTDLIRTEVSESITEAVAVVDDKVSLLEDAITTINSTMLTQTAEQFEMLFTQTGLQEAVTAVQTGLSNNQTELNTMTEYIRFESGNIILGKSGSESKVIISNNRISFMTGANESAYISNNQLYITDSTILNKLQVGHWEQKEDSLHNLNMRWVGGS